MPATVFQCFDRSFQAMRNPVVPCNCRRIAIVKPQFTVKMLLSCRRYRCYFVPVKLFAFSKVVIFKTNKRLIKNTSISTFYRTNQNSHLKAPLPHHRGNNDDITWLIVLWMHIRQVDQSCKIKLIYQVQSIEYPLCSLISVISSENIQLIFNNRMSWRLSILGYCFLGYQVHRRVNNYFIIYWSIS